MRSHTINSPLFIELGIKKKKKYYLNLNGYRNRHFQVSNKLKERYKEIISEQIKDMEPWNEAISVTFVYYHGTQRKSDIENNCIVHTKFFLDALVESGKLPSDDFDWVKEIRFLSGGYDQGNGRVEIRMKSYVEF